MYLVSNVASGVKSIYTFFYVAGANAVGGSLYGYSPAGIVLESVMCEGFESSLGGCPSSPLGRVLSSQCQNPSTDAAGVMCLLRQGIMHDFHNL